MNEVEQFISVWNKSVDTYLAAKHDDALFNGWNWCTKVRLTLVNKNSSTYDSEIISEINASKAFLQDELNEFLVDDYDPYGFRDEIVQCFENVYKLLHKHNY